MYIYMILFAYVEILSCHWLQPLILEDFFSVFISVNRATGTFFHI